MHWFFEGRKHYGDIYIFLNHFSGAIYYPGVYVLQSPDETVSDILDRAGGLRRNAYPIASTFTRQGQMVQIDLEEILKG